MHLSAFFFLFQPFLYWPLQWTYTIGLSGYFYLSVKHGTGIFLLLYNLGLEKAQIRDLTGAAEALKKSLHFNKYQTDARNLLGLIYYEMGEVSEAIVQWVISQIITAVLGKP